MISGYLKRLLQMDATCQHIALWTLFQFQQSPELTRLYKSAAPLVASGASMRLDPMVPATEREEMEMILNALK